MTERLQLALAGILALVAVALGGVLLFGGSGHDPDAYTVGPSGFAGSLAPPDIPVRGFSLVDQDGTPTSLASERGHVTVLTFLYSTCQDTCPIVASQIQGALDQLPNAGSSVRALAVSVDPAHDTPTLAKKFLLGRQLTGRMDFLLGNHAQLAPVWHEYGIQPEGNAQQAKLNPDKYEHTAYVFVLDKTGKERVSFPVTQLNPNAMAHDLRRLEAEPMPAAGARSAQPS